MGVVIIFRIERSFFLFFKYILVLIRVFFVFMVFYIDSRLILFLEKLFGFVRL